MTNPSREDPLGIRGTIIQEKYHVGDAIGEGGFSVVYKAEHMIWKQPVALKCFKVLANAPASQREQLLDGFIQEGKLMASLSTRSAAIVQARDVGTFTTKEGVWIPYMVLEWLEGEPLDLLLYDERLSRLPPRTLEQVMTLLEPAAVALEIAHSRNIAHRDVKPANFLVMGNARGPDAHIKVLDFGIAKVMAEHAQHAAALAQTGKEITAFTPNYGAPEQFSRSHGATGPWTDVFAMALIIIEMMRGTPTLEGDDLVQLSVASRDPLTRPTPRRFGMVLSDDIEAVFHQALAVSPADRYASMGDFWRALHRAVFPNAGTWNPTGVTSTGLTGQDLSRSRPLTGRHDDTSPTAIATPAMLLPQTGPGLSASTGAAPQKSGSGLGLVLGGLALLALGGGGFFAFTLAGGSQASPPVSTAAPSAAVSAPPVAEKPTTCPEDMKLVAGGKFFMGSDEASFPLWQPAHKVTIDTLCMDEREVTAGQYKACSDKGECKRAPVAPDYPKTASQTDEQHEANKAAYAELCTFGKPGLENHPINCVSWELADAYCKVMKKRLPTEAEWEYAARGSDGRKFPWGEDPGDEKHMNACGAECNRWEQDHGMKLSATMYDADDGYPGTAPVGSFPAGKTKFGLDDMVGNVWEWTADWFETYKPEEVVNPKGAVAGDKKAIRGGGFNGGVQLWLNPAFRYHQVATASSHGIGFRCAKDL